MKNRHCSTEWEWRQISLFRTGWILLDGMDRDEFFGVGQGWRC